MELINNYRIEKGNLVKIFVTNYMSNKLIYLYYYKSWCVRMQATLAPQEVNRVKLARTKSLVWEHFDDNNDGVYIFCILCAHVSNVTLRRIIGSYTTDLPE